MRHVNLRKDLQETHRRAVRDTLAGTLKGLDDVTDEPEETRWAKLMEFKVEVARQKSLADRSTSEIALKATVFYLEALQAAAADEGAATAFAHVDRGLAALLGPEPVPQHEIDNLRAHLRELLSPKAQATSSDEITETKPA